MNAIGGKKKEKTYCSAYSVGVDGSVSVGRMFR